MANNITEEILWKSIVQRVKYRNKKSLISFMRDIYIFKELSSWQLARMSQFLYKRTYEEGEYVFEANHPGAALFLVESGQVDIEIIKNDTIYTIASLGEKECLGDMSLIDDSNRSAAARAAKECVIYALHRKDLEQMMETDSDIACKIYQALAALIAKRLKAMNDLYESSAEGSENAYKPAS